ncbi:MAG: NrfD/PsrC family molybdoenzyme membrane anchor subunit [Candidatus Anstonellales archaeon]
MNSIHRESIPLDKFLVDFRIQEGWGVPIALYFFFCGTGASLFILSSLLFRSSTGILIDLFFLGIGALILFFDLGNRWRFWKAFLKPRSSWISRGTYLITFLFLYDFFYLLLGSSSFPYGLTFLGILVAIAVLLYPGFVLSYSPSISIWNHSFIPVLFGLHSLVNSFAIGWLIHPFNEKFIKQGTLFILLLILLLIGTLVFISVSYASNIGSKKSISLLVRGPNGLLFLWLGIGIGMIVPLFLMIPFKETPPLGLSALICLFRVAGDIGFRYSILRVGVYEPLI